MRLKDLEAIQEQAENGEADLSILTKVICEFFKSQSDGKVKNEENFKKITGLLSDISDKCDLILTQLKHPLYQIVLENEAEIDQEFIDES